MKYEVKLKSIIDEILGKYLTVFSMSELGSIITNLIRDEYLKGLEEAEVKFDMNFVPDPNEVQFMQKYAFDNVESLTTEVKDKLRKVISQGLMDGLSMHELNKSVSDVMDMSIDRAKMITITETNRANNRGFYQAAKDTGLDLVKQWTAQPERTSRAGNQVPCKHCEFLDNQIVEMDDQFTDDEGRKLLLPPHHPHCACRVLYVQRKVKNKII